MASIQVQLQATLQKIIEVAIKAGRAPDSVGLLAVSKRVSAERIKEAIMTGQRAFGESYVQEALPKIELLREYPLVWHFIGPIQSNKTKAISEHFAWVHSVDRLIIAQRLNDARPAHLPPLNICIQVNVSLEANKRGVVVEDVEPLATAIKAMGRLQLHGLMAIPAREGDTASAFGQLHTLYDDLNEKGYGLDTLSMGMSGDMELAIAQGATLIRIGTAIFGARDG